MSRRRPKVVILGGGMAAMAAAFDLSEGCWRDRFESIVVYQRGHRLGGKGASSRGVHGRIEEHGLHVLLGYYHQTFDLMRRCYEELDRARTDPRCPVRRWDDALFPSGTLGLMDDDPSAGWHPWVAEFSRLPAETGPPGPPDAWRVSDVVTRSVRLLVDFFSSLGTRPARSNGTVTLSTRPVAPDLPRPDALSGGLRAVSLSALAALLELSGKLDQRSVGMLANTLRQAMAADADLRRTYQLVDVVVANLVGVAADGLLTRPDGFAAIDDVDYRDWLRKHGADEATLASPLVRGSYDLVFGYEGGDPNRPRVSAGRALDLGTRMYFGYQGAIFRKMQGGMGETIFAPLYQLLRRRGVEFRFFHTVNDLKLSPDGRRVAEISMVREHPGRDYHPLIDVKGLPCWPTVPSVARGVPRRLCLRAGDDFDVIVFGIAVGMVPKVCPDIVGRHPAWRALVDHIGTTATQSMQLWLRETEREMGWRGGGR